MKVDKMDQHEHMWELHWHCMWHILNGKWMTISMVWFHAELFSVIMECLIPRDTEFIMTLIISSEFASIDILLDQLMWIKICKSTWQLALKKDLKVCHFLKGTIREPTWEFNKINSKWFNFQLAFKITDYLKINQPDFFSKVINKYDTLGTRWL